MRLESLQAAEQKLLLNTYERNPILFVSGHDVHPDRREWRRLSRPHQRHRLLGSRLWPSGVGGYDRRAVEEAPPHLQPLLHRTHRRSRPAPHRDQRPGRVFFCNSGTEAWEAALKLARAHAEKLRAEVEPSAPASWRSITASTAAPWARSRPPRSSPTAAPFAPVMPGVEFVAFNDVQDLRAKFSAGSGTGHLRHLHRGNPGRRRHSPRLAGVLRHSPRALRLHRSPAHRGRDPVRLRTHRQVVRLPALRHPARCHHPCQTLAGGLPSGPCSAQSAPRKPSLPACTELPLAVARWSRQSRGSDDRRDKAHQPAPTCNRNRYLFSAAVKYPRHQARRN